ncbi:MAG: dipicolinate synthase subunit DpsA [Clostridia bacterium]|nr:dipicolinate synthase subunit DpsA [Clostridia bacterium]
MVKLYFLGLDKRSIYLKELYEEEIEKKKDKEEYIITDVLEEANVVILPIPFTKDRVHILGEGIEILPFIKKCTGKLVIGGALSAFTDEFKASNVECIDLMEQDSIALLNAIPTAEGAIAKAMEYTDIVLHKSNVLVLGFGRVGKILAHKLKGLDANVFCEARKKKDLAHANALGYNVVKLEELDNVLGNIDIIFSTIPKEILKEDYLKLLKKDAVIIDLASSPGSVDYMAARKYNIDAHLELGLPSKVAPKSAAIYLKEEIDSILEHRFNNTNSELGG